METIVQKLENYYHQYLNLTSNVMLNLNTDSLLSKIESLPQCKQILNDLIKRHPITEQEIKSFVELGKIKTTLEQHNEEYYAAFCFQWYLYQKEHWKSIIYTYADKARWLTKTDKEPIDKILIFKTDVIRPIVDYVISQIKEHNLIYYYLERYKSRVERYTFASLADKNELGLQKDLALYLFDQGLSFYHEPNLGHGRPDFVINLDCNDMPFVVEIKKMQKLTQGIIDDSLRQLKAYLDQFPAYGCLYIFTEDVNYVDYSRDIDDKLTVRCVYLGEKSPSLLKAHMSVSFPLF